MPHIVVVGQAFKGSLSAAEVARAAYAGCMAGEPVVVQGGTLLPVARLQGKVWRGPAEQPAGPAPMTMAS